MHHEMGLNTDGGGLVCDCGHGCADLAAWHKHTVHTYNNPGELAVTLRGDRVHQVVTVEPGQSGLITVCTKVACLAQGNGAECWRLEMDGHATLLGLPLRQIAEDIAVRGGVVSTTYTFSTC